MGLNVTAYASILKIEDKEAVNVHEYSTYLYPNEDFPKVADTIIEGNYTFADFFCFNAGSYSGYDYWRSQLKEISKNIKIETEKYTLKYPLFVELINFSDCEGVIGAQTSLKLYGDFLMCQNFASTLDERFYAFYLKWMRAFELASKNGCIKFS